MKGEIEIDVFGFSEKGRMRELNEDYWSGPRNIAPLKLKQKGWLYIVADGMGGHPGGMRASQFAVEGVIQEYYSDPSLNMRQSLERAIKTVNSWIYQEGESKPTLRGMGTTLTAAILKGKDLLLANVGDSRAYLIRGGFIRQLTIDHSWIAEAIRTGAITEEKARTHPYRGAITRSLGTHPDVEVDFFRERITNGDVVFLCSDGLYKVVGDEEIQSIVSDSPSSQEAVRRLIDLANQRGGPDDITAVVLRIRRALALRPTPRRTSAWPLLLPLAGGIATLLMAIYFVKSPLSPTPTPPIEKIAIEQMVATETPVTKPVISPTSTPLPTSTPVPPTSTPTPLPTTSPIPTSTPTPAKYPAPRLVVPEDGAVFGGYYVDLLWDWEGELKEDEWFDVRVWVGNIERSIGIVKEEKYTLTTAPSGSGEYRWRIVVVRVGPGGDVLDEVSERSEERRFTWNLPGPPPTPMATPTPDEDPD